MVNKKVFIVYASGYGSTAEVAQTMAEELRTNDYEVEVQSADVARPPEDGEAVIIGSAIRYDRWLPAAQAYLSRHQQVLSTVSVAYFYTCLTIAGNPTSPESEQVYDSKLLAMNPNIKPIMVGGFAGTLNYEGMPWYFRIILGWITRSKGMKEGDYRDWAVIKDWVNDLTSKI